MTNPKTISRADLIMLLEGAVGELKRDASAEGCIAWRWGAAKGEYDVEAFVRTGNDEGQGGCWMVQGTTTTE